MNIQANCHTIPLPVIHLARMASSLKSMEFIGKRCAYHYIFEEMISENLNRSFEGLEDQLQAEVSEFSKRFINLMDKTARNEKVEGDVLKEIHALKETINQFVIKYFKFDSSALEYKIQFDHEKAFSISYLSSWDDRGLWGWEKVDENLQNLVKLMHHNPHLFHGGESCEGHIYDASSSRKDPVLSTGYITVCTDQSKESYDIITKIMNIAAGSVYARVAKNDSGGIESYSVIVGLENLTELQKKSLSLQEHRQEFVRIWRAIEQVLNDAAQGYKPINWKNEMSKELHLAF